MPLDKIEGFFGEYRFLSNFYSCVFYTADGKRFLSSEHLYQCYKATNDSDFEYIRHSASPAVAKQRGGKIPLRPDWDKHRDGYMLTAIRWKFTRADLTKLLLDTGNLPLIHANTHRDIYWGTCDGHGENRLGKLLMKLRKEKQDNERVSKLYPWSCP